MKILIICSSIIPNGGTERAISNLSRLLKGEDRIEVSIISICSSEEEKTAFHFYARIRHLGQEKLQTSLINKIKWYWRLIPILKENIKVESPDIILGIGHNISIMLPFITAKKCKIYACEHINFLSIPKIYRFLINCIYPKLTGIIALSEEAKLKLKHLNSNISIIPNSVSFPKACHSDLKNKSLIMVGRISKEKGYDRLPAIALILKEELPEWHINIFGDGPEREKIEQIITLNNLSDYVVFHGAVTDIQNKYSENSLLILTSYTEALPMVIIEANACGLPVIAYENEGVSALVKSEFNGYVIKNDDAFDFASKVIQLAKDYNMRKRLSENSLDAAEIFAEDSVKKKWLDLFYRG